MKSAQHFCLNHTQYVQQSYAGYGLLTLKTRRGTVRVSALPAQSPRADPPPQVFVVATWGGRGGFMRAIGEVELADLEKAEVPAVTTVSRLRSSHHNAAKLVAEGLRVPDVSAMTGYSPARLYSLLGDQAFQELVEHYKKSTQALYIGMHERLAQLGEDAVEVLQERLTDSPEQVGTADLIRIVEKTADRTGFAPVHRQENLNVTLSADALRRVKESVAGNSRTRSIADALREQAGEVSDAVVVTAKGNSKDEIEGESSKGDNV